MANDQKTVPVLTLTPDNVAAPTLENLEESTRQIAEKPPVEPVVLDESQLTPEEQEAVREFAKQIDITDSNVVMQYGSAAQKKVASFSESALANVRTKDMGEVGDMISSLVVELKGFNEDAEKKGFGLFRRARNKIATLKARYDKAEVNVEKICECLEGHQVQLLKDMAMLDKMYDTNLDYFKELTMYIIAGKQKLAEARATVLPELQKKAAESGRPEDAQAANDFDAMCNRFEKKLYDLELTRTISMQMAPQIRLVQNNDTMMVEKIQSTLVNTIPLWKSQMVLSLGIAHAQQAISAQREVTNLTNEMLKKNAETLKTGSIEAAKESERGIVDIETLQHTNQTLISTLDEVLQIQREGSQKRQQAEVELGRIEGELKQKLLELRG